MILALRALGLGDLLTAMPALRGLRRALPGVELALAAPSALAPLVHQARVVDRMVAVPSAVSAPPAKFAWRGPSPSLAVNLHGQGPQSTDALRGLRPGRLWSYGLGESPPWDPQEHEVRRWCRLVEAYGCGTKPEDLYLGPLTGHDGAVLIHPGAAHPQRRWPPQRYAAVARAIAGRGLPVRVTAGPHERVLAMDVAVRAGLPIESVISDIDLSRLADLVRGSRLVVCGDTGIAHLATAYRTPSIVLFGPQSPARWGPPVSPRHRVLWRPDAADGNPPDRIRHAAWLPHPALLRIEAVDVVAAADDLLLGGGTAVDWPSKGEYVAQLRLDGR
jgi:ADP-heptose:LPS heptosyltransferase